MGDTKNALIEFEETFHDELIEKFIAERPNQCTDEEWFAFVEDEFNNYKVGNE